MGTLALMQGGSAISKDLPPYTVARGDNGICGLNTVGLRRAGLSPTERLELKRLYHALFRAGTHLSAAVRSANRTFVSGPAKTTKFSKPRNEAFARMWRIPLDPSCRLIEAH